MKPLDGIRVVDLSRLLPGPMCSWYLAGLGAAVTTVESPDGDPLRVAEPVLASGRGAWFDALHAGKRSVCLNLKDREHKGALHALLADADVLIEGSRPGVMARLGFDPEDLLKRYPKLIVASITGFGQTGPMRSRPGHDLGFQAVAGALSLAARLDETPPVPGVPLGDVGGGSLTVAMRICAALFERSRTGRGCWIDGSMVEGTLAMIAPQVAEMSATQENPTPGGEMLTGGHAQYGVYRCSDGRSLAVASLEPKFWSRLIDCVGENVEPTKESLAAEFRTRSRDDWADRLGDACCEPVLDLKELAQHPQLVARRALTERDGVLRVSHPVPGGDVSATRASPSLGQHTHTELARVGFDSSLLKENK